MQGWENSSGQIPEDTKQEECRNPVCSWNRNSSCIWIWEALADKGCGPWFGLEQRLPGEQSLEARGCACLLPGSVSGAAHSVLGDSLVAVSAEKGSLKEMVVVSDVHVQGCHSLVLLQRLVLLLTSCWRLACVSWGKSGHPALKIAEDNWLLRSLQSVCGLRGNKSVHELLVSLSNMWLCPVFYVFS